MKKFSIFLLSLIFSATAFAQQGNYFLSNFSPDTDLADNVCFDIAQDNRGVFYFATQAGILQYDGRSWNVIRTNGAAYAIELAENGELYVAGPKGFGKIAPDNNGLESFQLLYDKPGAEYIFQIAAIKDKIYFLNERSLFIYSTTTDSTTIFSSSAVTSPFAGLTEIFGSVYISTEEQGLFRETNNQLTKSKLALPDSTQLVFSSKFENTYLLGTSDSRLFLYTDKMRLKELVLKEPGYVNASVIVNATWVSRELIALGTLRGGVIFINPVTGSTTEIMNYGTGLPDNEIYAIAGDKDQNVWVAHTYGYTRIAPYLPFRSFKHYPGLQGNLLCATTYQGNVYVGTSLGLYKLEKEDSYDEITYYVEVPIKTRKDKAPSVKVEKDQPEKKGFFSFLKRNKPETTTAKPSTQSTTPKRIRYKKEKRTKKILRSRYYSYRKVSGINAKITQLVLWQNKLIAAGLEGAFEINQLSSTSVLEDPVRFLLASEKSKTLFVSTYDDRLHQLSVNKNTWSDENLVQNIDDPINYIFEEGNEAIWFCSYDKIFRLEYEEGLTRAAQSINVDNPSFEKTVGVSLNGQVTIATSSGFYFYDKIKKELIKSDTLAVPKVFFANNSNLWFRDEHQWFVSGIGVNETNLQLLNLFNDIRYISSDAKSSNVWIITGSNELLRFSNDKIRPIETVYPLFLKGISQKNEIVSRGNALEIDQENSSLKIEVIRPDYIGANAVEYRYRLEGLHTEWSAWSSKNNVIDFPYLPPGDYTLHFESKDIFGKLSVMKPEKFGVLPPYWKRGWFYALEFAVFASLVLLSFKLNERYNLVRRLLSLLSVIILIELIQTITGSQLSLNSGPVVDFVIQVFVAFLVLPVEGFLRTFMLRSIEKKKGARNKA
jgi:ligand-binding sensor domain-containing protein